MLVVQWTFVYWVSVYILLWGIVDQLCDGYHAIIPEWGRLAMLSNSCWPQMKNSFRPHLLFSGGSKWRVPRFSKTFILQPVVSPAHTRQEVWPTSKVWNTHSDHTPDVVPLQLTQLRTRRRFQCRSKPKPRIPGNTDDFWWRPDQAAWWLMFGVKIIKAHALCKASKSLCVHWAVHLSTNVSFNVQTQKEFVIVLSRFSSGRLSPKSTEV